MCFKFYLNWVNFLLLLLFSRGSSVSNMEFLSIFLSHLSVGTSFLEFFPEILLKYVRSIPEPWFLFYQISKSRLSKIFNWEILPHKEIERESKYISKWVILLICWPSKRRKKDKLSFLKGPDIDINPLHV